MHLDVPVARSRWGVAFLLTLGVGLAAIGCGDDGGGGDRNSAAAAFFLESDEPLVIAHRGGPALGPEHTVETYRAGLDAGADVLEVDVHLTSDGEVVVLHDDTVDRTTDGTGAVSELTLAEIQALDAGHEWSPDGGETFPFRGQGIRIPTLGEVFEAFPDAFYVIEIKQAEPPMIDPFLDVLDAYEMRDRSVVASFSAEVMADFRRAARRVLTSFGEDEVIVLFFLADDAEAGYRPPAELLQLPPRQGNLEVLTPELIARADRFGLPIHAWTINDRAEMDRLLALGIAGLITDRPAEARAAVDALPQD